MKNYATYKLVQRAFLMFVLASLSFQSILAQDLIERKETDKEFANTTVVYKSKETDDLSILNQIDATYGSAGLGEVVRITVAPPPQAKKPPVYLASADTKPKNVSNIVYINTVAPVASEKKPTPAAVKTVEKKIVKAAPEKTKVVGTSSNRTDGGTSYSVSKEAGKSAYWSKKSKKTRKYSSKKRKRAKKRQRKGHCPSF